MANEVRQGSGSRSSSGSGSEPGPSNRQRQEPKQQHEDENYDDRTKRTYRRNGKVRYIPDLERQLSNHDDDKVDEDTETQPMSLSSSSSSAAAAAAAGRKAVTTNKQRTRTSKQRDKLHDPKGHDHRTSSSSQSNDDSGDDEKPGGKVSNLTFRERRNRRMMENDRELHDDDDDDDDMDDTVADYYRPGAVAVAGWNGNRGNGNDENVDDTLTMTSNEDDLPRPESSTIDTSTATGTNRNDESIVSAQIVDIEAEDQLREQEIRARIKTEAVMASVVDERKEKEKRRRKQRRNRLIALSAFLAVLVVVIVTSVVVTRRNQINDVEVVPTAAPTQLSSEEYLIQLFYPISGDELLKGSNTTMADNNSTVVATSQNPNMTTIDKPSASNHAMTWMLQQDQDDLFAIRDHEPEILIERFALATLYFSTNGPGWMDDTGFLSPLSVCEWPPLNTSARLDLVNRVDCNDENRVIAINTIENNLAGTIPSEVGSLAFLIQLHLQSEQLVGTIPYEMSALTSLTSLSLNNNMLSGSLHDNDFWDGMKFLRYLDLGYNQFNATIPSAILQNEDLEELRLYRNNLYGPIPDVSDRSAIRVLYLFNNFFSGSLPSSIFSLRELEILDVYSNSLTGTISSTIGNLASIVDMDLSYNSFFGPIPSEIGLLNRLEDFAGYWNDFDSTLPATMGNMIQLKSIGFIRNLFTGTIPSSLSRLDRTLTSLTIAGSLLTGTIPSELARLTKLDTIFLGYNLLNGTIPIEFRDMTNLQFVIVQNNSLTGSLDDVVCDLPKRIVGGIEADCLPSTDATLPEVNCTCCSSCCKDDTGECVDTTFSSDRLCSGLATYLEDSSNGTEICSCEDLNSTNTYWNHRETYGAETRLSCQPIDVSSTCSFCTSDGSQCVQAFERGAIWEEDGYTYTTSEIKYTRGPRKDSIHYRYGGAHNGNPPWCRFDINGEECASCQFTICRDSSLAHVIDCSNIVDGSVDVSSYNGCTFDQDDFGVFEALKSYELDPGAPCQVGFGGTA